MFSKKPVILVTNDDGITAPGIRVLIDICNLLGEVVIVAPDRPQSAMGHAITIADTLFCDRISIDKSAGIMGYSCSGTPVDCVKMATHELLSQKPDLCVSGINHGSNSSINVIYSGTMSAAVEAGIEGIPAIGFSLVDYSLEADFSHARSFVEKIIMKVLENGLPKGIVLNVNIPKKSDIPIRGISICRQAKARWQEKFDKRMTPQGRDYYWLTGEFLNEDPSEDTDEAMLAANYISVVPVQFDLTAHHFLEELSSWKM